MASYFNLTLDTLAPTGLVVKVNGDAQYITSTEATLTLSLTDSPTTGYQMKIWGIEGVSSEEQASWETYSTEKAITLTSGDGVKTVYVKVRDDVGNESSTASDTITLDTKVPVVTITGPDKSKISKIATFNQSKFTFSSDVAFVEYKVCVVPQSNSTQDSGQVIPTSAGSSNTSGTEGNYEASTPISVTITGTDLETASGGDGVKIVKVFVKTEAGLWSVA